MVGSNVTERLDKLDEFVDEYTHRMESVEDLSKNIHQAPIIYGRMGKRFDLNENLDVLELKKRITDIEDGTISGADIDITAISLSNQPADASGDIDANSQKIINVATPDSAGDATNKAFVEALVSGSHGFTTITGITNDVVADIEKDTLTLATGNNILSILGDAALDKITFTIDETNIDHDNLTNFVSDEHIAHSGVSITAGTGLTGGGDITATRTIALSHLGIESLTDPGGDRILFWDDGETACKWLAVGNSIAITTTTIDTIQDIRTSASPTFTALTLSDGNLSAPSLNFASSTTSGLYYDSVKSFIGISVGGVSYFEISGSYINVGTHLNLNDDIKIVLGNGDDGEIYVSSDNLYIKNVTQDKDIILGIDDGGVGKTITWDADVDKLKHSAGLFHFDNDNITTTSTITGGTLTDGTFSVTGGAITGATNTNWDAAFTHVSNDGSDHSFIDQSVISGANVTFGTIGCNEITVADGHGINLQEDITFLGATTENYFAMPDHLQDALSFKEAGNFYQTFVTTNSQEAVYFQQNVGIGYTPYDVDSTNTSKLSVCNNAAQTFVDFVCYSDTSAHDGYFSFRKSHHDTMGTLTATVDGEYLGLINWMGVTTTPAWKTSSYMRAIQDGASGAVYVPSKIVIYTSSTTSTNLALTIRSDADVVFQTTGAILHYNTGASAQFWFVRNAIYDGGWKRLVADNDVSFLGYSATGELYFYRQSDANATAGSAVTLQLQFKIADGGTIYSLPLAGGAINLTADASGNIIRDPSDISLKTNINPIDDALDIVRNIDGYSFDWKKEANMGEDSSYGFIANYVEEKYPNLVSGIDKKGIRSKDAMIAIMWEAIKKLDDEVELLKAA